MYIPVVLGTAREGRQSEKVARFIYRLAQNAGLETEIVDIREYRIPATDNTGAIPHAKRWGEKVVRADALIIVSPEYNHTYPGELKMFLDMLYKEYARKPIALCGVSSGPWGGTRGIQALRLTCIALGMHPILETVYFPFIKECFDGEEKIKDAAFEKSAGSMIRSLIVQAEALISAR